MKLGELACWAKQNGHPGPVDRWMTKARAAASDDEPRSSQIQQLLRIARDCIEVCETSMAFELANGLEREVVAHRSAGLERDNLDLLALVYARVGFAKGLELVSDLPRHSIHTEVHMAYADALAQKGDYATALRATAEAEQSPLRARMLFVIGVRQLASRRTLTSDESALLSKCVQPAR